MRNDSTADPSHAPGSDHEDDSTWVELSANTVRGKPSCPARSVPTRRLFRSRTRLEKLAPWRIDPALLKFPKRGPNFEGGYPIVSRTFLASSSDETRKQVVEPNGRNLKSNNGIAKLQDDGGGEEAEGIKQEEERKYKEGVEGEVQESDNEASGQWKVSVNSALSDGFQGRPLTYSPTPTLWPVAVKKMKMKTEDDIVRILGFTLSEAEFLVKLSHQNVIKLEGFVENASNGVIWLVFPWEENGTLKDFVASHDWEIPERMSLLKLRATD
ncbi:hypothetical protein FS837_011626 [Tulasnella sp. UAMH 9824]|nr:hypothetical protein FS837_011626 [Tulasnella sp. UAMH 9824]